MICLVNRINYMYSDSYSPVILAHILAQPQTNCNIFCFCTLANKSLNEYGESPSNRFRWEIHIQWTDFFRCSPSTLKWLHTSNCNPTRFDLRTGSSLQKLLKWNLHSQWAYQFWECTEKGSSCNENVICLEPAPVGHSQMPIIMEHIHSGFVIWRN